MDLKITNFDVSTEQIYLEQVAESPLYIDFTLSDYEDDIKKILACEIFPYITEKHISGNAFTVESEVVVKVIYCTQNGDIYCTEQTLPFKKNFDSEKNLDNGCGDAKISATVHSCRAVTERKISIRSTLKLEATVTLIEKNEIISDIDCDTFEQLKGEAFATIPLGITQKNIIIDEEIVLSQNSPAAKRIIRTDAVSNITDCKIVADKTIVKGNLKVTIFYCTEDNEYHKYSENIPFNQIVDIPGITEFCECNASSTICGLNISARTSEENEGRKFMLICKLEIKVLARCSNNIPVIYDLYSTNCLATPKCSKVSFPKLVKQASETFLCKKSIKLPENEACEILDIWCNCGKLNSKFKEKSVVLSGNILTYIMYVNSEGFPDFFEKSIDFEYPINLDEEVISPKCYPEIIIADCDFDSLNSNEPELKLELIINSAIYDTYSYSVITELDVDETVSVKNKASLIAYYADKGENVWKIAKHFSAKRSEILKLNHLSEETIPTEKMLLIPLM